MSQKIYAELIQYEKARLRFCQTIAEAATRPQFITYMENEGVIELVHPLLSDPEPTIRSNAVCCVSRMANRSISVAKKLVDLHIPEIILKELAMERNINSHYQRAVMQAIKSVAKHSLEMAAHIVACGGMTAQLISLDSTDAILRENACCGIGCIVRQSADLAMTAINQGVIPSLLTNIQQNEMNLKRIATLVLSDISRHSADHAEAILRADALSYITANIDNVDEIFKKYTLIALGNLGMHKLEHAVTLSQWNIIPKILIHLGHDSHTIQKYAARFIQEIVKHSIELAQIVVNDGGIGALVQMLFKAASLKDDFITPGATALGYIAGWSPHFALAIIESKGVSALSLLLEGTKTNCQLASCAWALGHIGKHSSEHCRPLAETNLFSKIMEIYDISNDDDLKDKLKETLKSSVQCCLHVPALEMLLYNVPTDVLEMVLNQFAKILPNNDAARRMFLTTGPLRKILALDAEPDSNIAQLIESIKSCYSNEVIKMYSPRLTEQELSMTTQMKPQDFFVNSGDDYVSTDGSIKSSAA